MYEFVLLAHSWLRWVLLLSGLALTVAAFLGWRRGTPWTAGHERLRKATVGVMDLQLLLGLVLYFVLSPITAVALANFGAAMKDPSLRFYGVEHSFTMFIAVVVMHVGHVRAKRRAEGMQRSLFITQCVWLLLVLLAIPWPMLDIGRPLFRL